MKTCTPSVTVLCHCCGRRLPLSEFYLRTNNGRPDSYCKLCRRTLALGAYIEKAKPCRPSRERRTLLDVADRDERLRLILEAKRRVWQLMEAKRRKIREQEEIEFWKSIDKE